MVLIRGTIIGSTIHEVVQSQWIHKAALGLIWGDRVLENVSWYAGI